MAVPSSVTPVRYDLAQFATVTTVLSATSFIANGLAGFPTGTFVGYSVWVLSKGDLTTTAPKAESPKLINTFLGTTAVFPSLPGTVTHAAFTANLAVGDSILLLNPAVAAAWRSYVLPVPPTVPGTSTMYGNVVGNWQAAETDLLTIGAATAGSATAIASLIVGIQNLVGNVTIRLYVTVNGVERQVYPTPLATTWLAATDGPALPIIEGDWAFPGRLRVTIQSDNAADNGAAVTYEAM